MNYDRGRAVTPADVALHAIGNATPIPAQSTVHFWHPKATVGTVRNKAQVENSSSLGRRCQRAISEGLPVSSSEVREQVKADAARRSKLNLLLAERDVTFLLSIGVSCRRSWRDGSHDRLKAEHLEIMERIRVEHETDLL